MKQAFLCAAFSLLISQCDGQESLHQKLVTGDMDPTMLNTPQMDLTLSHETDFTLSSPLHQDLGYELLYATDIAADTESAFVPRKPRLLPENMSIIEKAFWSENGILRTIGVCSPLTPEVRKHELSVRRTMLSAHQIGGFITWGLMTAAVIYGQKYLDNGQRTDLRTHKTFVTATIIGYTGTGLLSILSPPPSIRRDEISTTTIHKALAWVHVLGMVATPIIGSTIKHSSDYYGRAHFHQTAAYITLAAFTAAMITVTI